MESNELEAYTVVHCKILQKPIILALSNPTSQSDCTTEQAYKWSMVIISLSQIIVSPELCEIFYCHGSALIVRTHRIEQRSQQSPFDPVECDGKIRVPGHVLMMNTARVLQRFCQLRMCHEPGKQSMDQREYEGVDCI
jgi:hypothetical protein